MCSSGMPKLNLRVYAKNQEKMTTKESCKKAKSIFKFFT